MTTRLALLATIMCSLVGLASDVARAEKPGNYVALKGGIYSPSATFNLQNLDVETTFDADTETGFDGEVAYGHYVLPTLAVEVGAGYFKGKGAISTTPSESIDFDVIPLIVSAKALIPVGQVDPYGELGIGAYFTSFDVSNNLNTFEGTTTFGIHAGAGLNVNIAKRTFIGLEGRYIWAEPSFGDQTIKLNDAEYSLDGFKLNGFTTTLVLGFSF